MVNIDKILKKKGWTGEELGRLFIANALTSYKNMLETGDANPPVKEKDLDKMIATLDSSPNIKAYNNFMAVYRWVVRIMQTAIAQEQQAQLYITKLLNRVTNAVTAEDLYRYIENQPVIMTEKQYKDTVERRTQEIINPEGGIGHSVLGLILHAIDYYIELLESKPRATNPLKALRTKLKKEAVTSPHILTLYNEKEGKGYYTLEDGTRSDSLTAEEWEEKARPVIISYFSGKKLGDKEKEIIGADVLNNRPVKDVSSFFSNGGTQKEAERLKQERELIKSFSKVCEWHYYEDQPASLNKWEFLESGNLWDYLYNDSSDNGADLEALKEFTADYTEVIKAIQEDIAKNYPDLKEIKKAPVDHWTDGTYCIEWEALYNMDFYGFRETYTGYNSIFEGDYKALFNGVAILQDSDRLSHHNIDQETGYYKAPEIRKVLDNLSLEGLFSDAEEYASNLEDVEDARETLIASLYYMKAFNMCLDLIASMYDIEEVKIVKTHVDFMEERIRNLNKSITGLYEMIADTRYEDTELKEKKLLVLKEILYPVDLKYATVPKKRIERTKEALEDFKAFKDNKLDPATLLCVYDPLPIKEELEAGKGV